MFLSFILSTFFLSHFYQSYKSLCICLFKFLFISPAALSNVHIPTSISLPALNCSFIILSCFLDIFHLTLFSDIFFLFLFLSLLQATFLFIAPPTLCHSLAPISSVLSSPSRHLFSISQPSQCGHKPFECPQHQGKIA